jgi:putative endonuclease
MYYVYVLKSEKDGSTYIGCTEFLERRIEEHNKGKTKSIKNKLPMVMVYFEAYQTKTLALKREKELKKNSFAKEQLYKRII